MTHAADVSAFRARGPRGLDAWIQQRGAGASAELDRLCQQKDAHTSLLYWFTELPAASAEARRTGKPILSLRLLGNLDEELSCANSRFFRKLLYPDPRVNRLLRERFILHWQSVRPVPIVTIDFGGGKQLRKTITGNSVHLVLDAQGRPVDALPGLMRAETFAQQLIEGHALATGERRRLAQAHARRLAAAPPAAPAPSRAMAASALAMSKHRVELPLLRAVEPLDQDDAQHRALHRRIHEAFAAGHEWREVEDFVAWIYAELFLMPLSDPALGLDVEDPFGNSQASVGQPTLPAASPPAPPVQVRPSPVRRLASTIARAFPY